MHDITIKNKFMNALPAIFVFGDQTYANRKQSLKHTETHYY